MAVTKPQFKALWAAFKKGNACAVAGSRMGGANSRMIDRMTKEQLLSCYAPYPITLKGLKVLREACHARWAKDGCQAYHDELKEVEEALRGY